MNACDILNTLQLCNSGLHSTRLHLEVLICRIRIQQCLPNRTTVLTTLANISKVLRIESSIWCATALWAREAGRDFPEQVVLQRPD
jgi:hypothetical protein